MVIRIKNPEAQVLDVDDFDDPSSRQQYRQDE
jgi:hypothetical protein